MKIIHKGTKIRADGSVSALCFKQPKPIDLSKENWAYTTKGVTCPKCLKIIQLSALGLKEAARG